MDGVSEHTAQEESKSRPALLAVADNVCSSADIRQGFTETGVDVKGESLSGSFDVTGCICLMSEADIKHYCPIKAVQ